MFFLYICLSLCSLFSNFLIFLFQLSPHLMWKPSAAKGRFPQRTAEKVGHRSHPAPRSMATCPEVRSPNKIRTGRIKSFAWAEVAPTLVMQSFGFIMFYLFGCYGLLLLAVQVPTKDPQRRTWWRFQSWSTSSRANEPASRARVPLGTISARWTGVSCLCIFHAMMSKMKNRVFQWIWKIDMSAEFGGCCFARSAEATKPQICTGMGAWGILRIGFVNPLVSLDYMLLYKWIEIQCPY